MDSQVVLKKVQGSNRNILILSLIALAILAAGIYFLFFPYFSAKFQDPQPIKAADIFALTADSSTLYFRQITGSAFFDTGYYEYTEDEDTGRLISTDAYFGILLLEGNKFLMVRSPDTIADLEGQTTLVGALSPIKSQSIASQVHEELRREYPDIPVLPVMLDEVDNEFGWYAGATVAALIGLAGVWGIFLVVQRSSDPTKHPTMKKLSRYGDLQEVISDLEGEMQRKPKEDKKSQLQLTESWAIESKGTRFNAVRFEDVIWMYKKIQKGRYGKTYYAIIADRHGEMMTIQAKEKDVDAMLTSVIQHAPWALTGYTNDINKAWSKDRQQLIAAVEQRKSQMMQQQSF